MRQLRGCSSKEICFTYKLLSLSCFDIILSFLKLYIRDNAHCNEMIIIIWFTSNFWFFNLYNSQRTADLLPFVKRYGIGWCKFFKLPIFDGCSSMKLSYCIIKSLNTVGLANHMLDNSILLSNWWGFDYYMCKY